MTKENHFELLSTAEMFCDQMIDTVVDLCSEAGESALFHLAHLDQTNTFLLTFNSPTFADWTVTYDRDDVQATAA